MGKPHDEVDQRLGLGVLRELEIGVDHEVRRVVIIGLDLERRSVRGDGLLPHPHHRIDV